MNLGCITAVNTYVSNDFNSRELVRTTSDNITTPFIEDSTVTLSFADGKFTVTIDSTGEVIDRGCAEICYIAAVSSRYVTDYIIDEGKRYRSDDFMDIFRGQEAIRKEITMYSAYFIRDVDGTAIGIVKHDGDATDRVASLYADERKSNRESFLILEDYLNANMSDVEYAIVSTCNIKIEPYDCARFTGRASFRVFANSSRFDEAKELAETALSVGGGDW